MIKRESQFERAGKQGAAASEQMRLERVHGVMWFTLLGIVTVTPIIRFDYVYNFYVLPKFALLLIGASLLVGLLLSNAFAELTLALLCSPFGLLLAAYGICLGISTVFSVLPGISFLGSSAREMGYLTYLCYVAVSLSCVIAIRDDRKRFEALIWGVVVAGFIVALVGAAQVAGLATVPQDPASPVALAKRIFRINATLGHPDYAGNYLLYVVFTACGATTLARRAWSRGLCIATVVLAAFSILFTGTRGAWIGFLAGCFIGIAMMYYGRRNLLSSIPQRKKRRRAYALFLVAVLMVGMVAVTSLGKPIRTRLVATYSEGLTGAGRTTLWVFAIRIVPHYLATGCGLDVFRLASLPYKTVEVARAIKGVNQEDPHNAYLSAVVSSGIFSAVLYVCLIVIALWGFVVSIRRSRLNREKWLGLGLLCSFCAVLAHNVFLFHEITTGLYFFLFIALSQSLARVTLAMPGAVKGMPKPLQRAFVLRTGWLRRAIGGLLLLAACVYSYKVIEADHSILSCLQAAARNDLESTLSNGRAASSTEVFHTDYHYIFAAALSRFERAHSQAERTALVNEAAREFEVATHRSLAPEAGYVGAGLMRIRLGDLGRAETLLLQASQLDPLNPSVSLALARLSLGKGDLNTAVEQVVKAGSLGARRVSLRTVANEILERANNTAEREFVERELRPFVIRQGE